MKKAINRSEATRRLCSNGLVVSLLGMHANLHPSIRLHWKKRMVLSSVLPGMLGNTGLSTVATTCVVEFRESMRRMLSNCTSTAYASVAAMLHIKHPSALLQSAPFSMPNTGLETACIAFARAGKCILEAHGNGDLSQYVRDAFKSQTSGSLAWMPGYLGALLLRGSTCLRRR